MDVQNTFDRIKAILLNPKSTWPEIKQESRTNKNLIIFYALPLSILAGLASLVNFLSSAGMGFGYGLQMVVLQIAWPLITIVIASFVINTLAENFNSTKDLNSAFKLVTYSYTPSLLAAIITNLSWTLGWVGIVGLYGIYLFWIGLPVLMETPEEKRGGYVLAAAVIIIVVNLVIGALLGFGSMGRAGYLG
ncbi:MAG: Yip1 family protein [Balneolaceae bacterium]|nr:Yip1 family protein [Balneolaceae bacterium]